MPRSFSEDEWELMDIPRQLLYEASYFGNTRPCVPWGGSESPTIDQVHRIKHKRLLTRQTELQERIRRNDVLTRWVMSRHRDGRTFTSGPIEPLTPMLVDEVIEGGKIVDQG
jgi:hypothetical protein